LQAGTLRFGVLELGTPKQGKGAKLMQEERALEKFPVLHSRGSSMYLRIQKRETATCDPIPKPGVRLVRGEGRRLVCLVVDFVSYYYSFEGGKQERKTSGVFDIDAEER
jgi:hypothetical protein